MFYILPSGEPKWAVQVTLRMLLKDSLCFYVNENINYHTWILTVQILQYHLSNNCELGDGLRLVYFK